MTENEIKFENICDPVMKGKELYKTQVNFRSVNHTMFTVTAEKKALSDIDDKRIPHYAIFPDDKSEYAKITTYAIGWNDREILIR